MVRSASAVARERDGLVAATDSLEVQDRRVLDEYLREGELQEFPVCLAPAVVVLPVEVEPVVPAEVEPAVPVEVEPAVPVEAEPAVRVEAEPVATEELDVPGS